MTNDEFSTRDAAAGCHPSFEWTSALRTDPAGPIDRAGFEQAMRHPRYPLASAYNPDWVRRNLMGPNCLWLAESLGQEMGLAAGQRVLDLGCGSALTSIFLAREYGVEVWAADLWIDPADNHVRVKQAGLDQRVFPLRAEARNLPFAPAFFDAIVSVDAFHYFGTEVRYLSYLAQFLKPGGLIGFASPANAVDPDEADFKLDDALFDAFGADLFTFRSPAWWHKHWSRTRGATVELAEMMPGGRELWLQSLQAEEAWSGVPVAEQPDARLLLSEAGESLGFCRVVARRGQKATLEFGPGEFATRIA